MAMVSLKKGFTVWCYFLYSESSHIKGHCREETVPLERKNKRKHILGTMYCECKHVMLLLTRGHLSNKDRIVW